MIEIVAILCFCYLAWQHGTEAIERLLIATGHRRTFTPGRYRRALRRFAQRRYRQTVQVRQQVRVLEHIAWQMRRDGSPEPMPVHCMTSEDVLPFLYVRPETPGPIAPTEGRYRGIASLIGQPGAE